ncbi:tetratricopeptide repeat protein [Rhodopirellula islandica]|uniref:tetratricopeptide repeat protein n=1 Tax=Rhodopirellula islandica TaxID=595434 RepID=UPI0009FAAA59|nr:tetratricopeptide repeat protein [Rhodopirellula islandica]
MRDSGATFVRRCRLSSSGSNRVKPLRPPTDWHPKRCNRWTRLVRPETVFAFSKKTLQLGLLLTCFTSIPTSMGCRGIGRFGESRQSIAARRLSRQGLKAMRQGEWAVAETLFTEALDVSSVNDAAHRGMSESLWQKGQQDDAIEHLEKAVQLSAGDPKHMQRLGRMYLEVGRVDEATRQCQIALDSDREWAALWALWGDCQVARNEKDEALAAYHRALSLQPDYPYVQLRTAEIYHQQKRYDRLLATLDRIREDADVVGDMDEAIRPGAADLLRGIAMRELGRSEESVQYFIASARKNPSDATSRLQLASVAVETGQPQIAQTWLAQAMRLDPAAVRDAGWNVETWSATPPGMISPENAHLETSAVPIIAAQPDAARPWIQ